MRGHAPVGRIRVRHGEPPTASGGAGCGSPGNGLCSGPDPLGLSACSAVFMGSAPQDARLCNDSLGRLLGAGGMGSVYLAHDLVLDRAVAINFIAPERAT